MFLMVILRNVIEVETLDFSELAKVRAPVTPGFSLVGDGSSQAYTWETDNETLEGISASLDDFFQYATYPN